MSTSLPKTFFKASSNPGMQNKLPAKLSDKENQSIQPIDLRLSVVKPLGGKWMIELHDYFKQNPDIIKNGFSAASITECLSELD